MRFRRSIFGLPFIPRSISIEKLSEATTRFADPDALLSLLSGLSDEDVAMSHQNEEGDDAREGDEDGDIVDQGVFSSKEEGGDDVGSEGRVEESRHLIGY